MDKSDDRGIVVRVNGGEFRVYVEEPTAREILELAKKQGLMPGEPGTYYLWGDGGKRSVHDRIDIREENVFLTIPTEPTPVA